MKRGASWQYALEPEQEDRLYVEANNTENRIILKLLIVLGMRVSEVAHLNQDWLHATDKGLEIRVPQSQDCDCSNCRGEWKAKSLASVRIIPVPQSMVEEIIDYLRHHPKGFGLTRQAIWYRLKKISRRAAIRQRGLSGNTTFPHALRATAATRFASFLSASELCYIMGWKNLEIGQHYISIAQARSGAHEKIRQLVK